MPLGCRKVLSQVNHAQMLQRFAFSVNYLLTDDENLRTSPNPESGFCVVEDKYLINCFFSRLEQRYSRKYVKYGPSATREASRYSE
jgi:hypothetical protein